MKKTIALIISIAIMLCTAIPAYADDILMDNIKIVVTQASTPGFQAELSSEVYGSCELHIKNGITMAESELYEGAFGFQIDHKTNENKAYVAYKEMVYIFIPGQKTVAVQTCTEDGFKSIETIQFKTPILVQNGKLLFPFREMLEKMAGAKVDYEKQGDKHIIRVEMQD